MGHHKQESLADFYTIIQYRLRQATSESFDSHSATFSLDMPGNEMSLLVHLTKLS